MNANAEKESGIYLALLKANLELLNIFSDCSLYIISCMLSLTDANDNNIPVYDPILKVKLSDILNVYIQTLVKVLQEFPRGVTVL